MTSPCTLPATMYAACEGGAVEESVKQFADRLTALIERGVNQWDLPL